MYVTYAKCPPVLRATAVGGAPPESAVRIGADSVPSVESMVKTERSVSSALPNRSWLTTYRNLPVGWITAATGSPAGESVEAFWVWMGPEIAPVTGSSG